MIVGYLLVTLDLINYLRNIEIIGWTTIVFGIVLYFSDRYDQVKNINEDFNYKSAIIIGVFQILSFRKQEIYLYHSKKFKLRF